MNMKPVEGSGAPRTPAPITPDKLVRRAAAGSSQPAEAELRRAGAESDSVEFSADARKLAAGAADGGSSREELIAAAKQKLLSGQLSGPACADRAAEKLLRSGDLGKVKDDAAGSQDA